MIEKESIPFAPNLIESMRSLGYSFETAIADLVDNSISANAKNVKIFLTPDDSPKLIIFDDGDGMDSNKLEEALRYGSKGPTEERSENDLGRFGLGLKSASFSQCRKLIVASKQSGKISCYSWDLDVIIEKKGWILLQYGDEEIRKLPRISMFDEVESGTYILLQNFDKISSSTNDFVKTITNYMNNTIDHLALVFHRFLEDDVKIFVNNNEVVAIDPFLANHKSTQILRKQYINIDSSIITVQPYILPYLNKLTREDIKKVGGKEDLKNNQGFYIYRNKRLIIWGTWFRLVKKEELSKLARIKVDIPSTLDYMWGLDIKKSSVNLPDLIKNNLYNVIYESTIKSKNVHEYRGRRVNEGGINYVWERIELRDGCYEYRINKDIPSYQMLERSLDSEQFKMLNLFIDNIEKYFPTNSIYLDTSKGNIIETEDDVENLYDEIKEQIKYCEEHNMDVKKMLQSILKTEPYCKYEDLINKLKKEVNFDE